MSFKQWMSEVDKELSSICGLSYLDIADQHWHDWYDDEVSPHDAAVEALINEGFPF